MALTHRRALLGLHVGALAFGLCGVFGKLALVSPLIIVFGRAFFALFSILPFIRLKAGQRRPTRRQFVILLLAGVLLGIHWLTFFQAVKVAGVAVATLGFASFPAFTVLLEGLFFRERIRLAEWALVSAVTLGLVLVTPNFDFGSEATAGLLWAVFSGLLFAVISLINRGVVTALNPAQAALCQNGIIVVCLLPLVWAQLPDIRALDWLWLALLGVFCTGVAHSVFVASLAVLKARTAAVVFALEPVYGIAFAWLLFAEQPSARMLLGGALIIGAIVVTSRIKAPPVAHPVKAPESPGVS